MCFKETYISELHIKVGKRTQENHKAYGNRIANIDMSLEVAKRNVTASMAGL
jgi:hypothetical protein